MMDGLKDKHRKTIMDILSSNKKVERAVLFGSRATGTFTIDSDVDLALWGKGLTSKELGRLSGKLEESSVPQEVDLLLYESIENENLLREIDRRGVEWYSNKFDGEKSKKNRQSWRKVRLGEVAFINPLENIPKGIKAKKVLMDDLVPFNRRISSYVIATYKGGSKFRSGDTLVARITPYLENGKTTFIDFLEDEEIGFGSTEFIVLRNKQSITDKYFLYYLSISPFFRSKAIKSMTGTSGRQRVQIPELINYVFPLPPLQEQKTIAQVLSSLDDKIELNHQMNKMLESIAQAIFKSWFVDFEPVHAKRLALESGLSKEEAEQACMAVLSGVCSPAQYVENPDKMNAKLKEKLSFMSEEKREELKSTASLFPWEFENSKLGKIPCGWRLKELSSQIIFNPKLQLKKGIIASYVDMKSLPTLGHRVNSITKKEFKSGSKFQNGDILLARITPCLENGKTAYIDCLLGKETAWGSTEFIVMRPRKNLPNLWIYLLSRDKKFIKHAISNMSGTSGRQRVPVEVLEKYKFPFCNFKLYDQFKKIINPLFKRIKTNSVENNTLEYLRDTLLPKLLAGEIDLKNIKYNDNKDKTQKQKAKT